MADIINGNPHAGNQTPVETEVNLDKMTIKEKCNKILDILKPWSQKLSATGNDDGSITIKPGHGKPNINVHFPGNVYFSINESDNSIDFIYYDEQLGDYRLYATYNFDSNGNLINVNLIGNGDNTQYVSVGTGEHGVVITDNNGGDHPITTPPGWMVEWKIVGDTVILDYYTSDTATTGANGHFQKIWPDDFQ